MKYLNQLKSNEYRMRHVLFGSVAVMAFATGSALAQDEKKPTQNQQSQQAGMDVTVDQAEPNVSVDQKKPIVTVKQYPPEVTVKQPPPEITVRMPEPEVTINQQKPDVQIKMPDPEVNVKQQDPEVNITRSEPDVNIQNSQKPQVDIQQADADVKFQEMEQPKVTVEQSEPKVTVEKSSKNQQNPQQIMSMKGNEIVGKNLMGGQNETVGKITDLVIDKKSKKMFAVVDVDDDSTGQADGIVVAVEKINIKQGQLMADENANQIKQSQGYKEDEYQSIELNRPVSDFSSLGSN